MAAPLAGAGISRMVKKAAVGSLALLAYGFFLVVLVYAIGFLLGAAVPKGIDSGRPGAPAAALLIDLGLLGLFAAQHSVMARKSFKERWTRLIPKAAERSAFVLLASGALALLFWQWRPLPGRLWAVHGAGAAALIALNLAGWGLVVASTWMTDHLDLFGLRQAYLHWLGRPYSPIGFTVRSAYRLVRHPMMAGLAVAFWAAPVMTVGHALFAAAGTAYILFGIQLEERDLVRELGPQYESYRRQVPMLLPVRGWRRNP